MEDKQIRDGWSERRANPSIHWHQYPGISGSQQALSLGVVSLIAFLLLAVNLWVSSVTCEAPATL